MAKQAYVYSGTEWVPLASEVTNLSAYQTKASNQFAHRNIIINGDMQIAQRGTSTASITGSGYWTSDRWKTSLISLGTWTMSVENDAPTGSGFRKSTKLLCTTADASPAAGDIFSLRQLIEGQNLQHIKKGTAAAEQLTLSFWVKSNVTGNYVVSLYDADNNRTTGKSYTISSSATWEYKTLTFAADTTGAFDNDNNSSLYVDFGLAAGSNFTSGTLQSSWTTYSDSIFLAGQVNLASATNNYWQITGVQLEVGATATPFEFKSVEDELLECQRYYWRAGGSNVYQYYGIGIGANSTTAAINVNCPVPMRATPTSIDFSTLGVSDTITLTAVTNVTADILSPVVASLSITVASGLTQYRPYRLLSNNSLNAYLGLSAEL